MNALHSIPNQTCIEVFGDFHKFLNPDGVPTIFWEEEILTHILLPAPLPLAWNHSRTVSGISCHKLIAPFLSKALNDIHSMPEVWDTINDYGGCYTFRLQRKSSSSLSKHCWAIAIDLDVGDNPFSKEPKVHPHVIECFENNGFIWGGNFPIGRKDGMHFEFADLSRIT